jgi:ElaB/YqjD/DUF883 family membrane-anchored ribosome-binding protein
MMCCEDDNAMIKKLEGQLAELKSHYAAKVEPVEKVICEHPIPSVLVAAGAGLLLGMLIYKLKK